MSKVVRMIDGANMSEEERNLLMKDGTVVARTPSGEFEMVINSVGVPMIRTKTDFCLIGTPIHYLFMKDVKAEEIQWCDSETGEDILSEDEQFKRMMYTKIMELTRKIIDLERKLEDDEEDD